ncbi:MAG: hypothetical protein K2V38_20135, partial [Gemmataceae bacterium]|nr:hypothetical protein [Gemmataceae bacterium]
MYNEEQNKKPQGFGADTKLMLACFLWAAHIMALPQLSFRKWRGSRADSILTKLAAVAFFPVVFVLGGGGDKFIFIGVYGLLVMGTLSARGEKYAARYGLEISSRFVGIPLPKVLFPSMGNVAFLLEPVGWLVFAGLLGL